MNTERKTVADFIRLDRSGVSSRIQEIGDKIVNDWEFADESERAAIAIELKVVQFVLMICPKDTFDGIFDFVGNDFAEFAQSSRAQEN